MSAVGGASSLISKPMIKIIYTLAQELNLVDKMSETDALHEMVFNMIGKEHISDLNSTEADSIINRLKGNMKGFDRITVQTRPANMATEGEIKKIWALIFELKKYDNPGEPSAPMQKRLRGFLKKYAGIDDIRFLTHDKAYKVIEGLKGLIKTEKKKFPK